MMMMMNGGVDVRSASCNFAHTRWECVNRRVAVIRAAEMIDHGRRPLLCLMNGCSLSCGFGLRSKICDNYDDTPVTMS